MFDGIDGTPVRLKDILEAKKKNPNAASEAADAADAARVAVPAPAAVGNQIYIPPEPLIVYQRQPETKRSEFARQREDPNKNKDICVRQSLAGSI